MSHSQLRPDVPLVQLRLNLPTRPSRAPDRHQRRRRMRTPAARRATPRPRASGLRLRRQEPRVRSTRLLTTWRPPQGRQRTRAPPTPHQHKVRTVN